MEEPVPFQKLLPVIVIVFVIVLSKLPDGVTPDTTGIAETAEILKAIRLITTYVSFLNFVNILSPKSTIAIICQRNIYQLSMTHDKVYKMGKGLLIIRTADF